MTVSTKVYKGQKPTASQIEEIMNIPFFVDSETGEVEHLFRANWSVIPPRLITHSGMIVH